MRAFLWILNIIVCTSNIWANDFEDLIKFSSYNNFEPLNLSNLLKALEKSNLQDSNYVEKIMNKFQEVTDTITLNLSDLRSINKYIDDAQLLMSVEKIIPYNKYSLILKGMGDIRFERLCDKVQTAVNEKRYNKKSEINFIILRLQANNYSINMPVNNLKKTIKYIKEGKFKYVIQKLFTTYIKYGLMLAIASIIIIFFIAFWSIKGFKLMSGVKILLLVLFSNLNSISQIQIIDSFESNSTVIDTINLKVKDNYPLKFPDLINKQLQSRNMTFGKSLYNNDTFYFLKISRDYFANLNIEFTDTHSFYDSFLSIIKSKAKKDQQVIMLMNLGMYDNNFRPLGLLLNKGKIIQRIKRIPKNSECEGNFFLTPGIFLIDTSNIPSIISIEKYLEIYNGKKVLYATQSGPILISSREINSKFNKKSKNMNIRNAVGISVDNNIVFVISENRVNFYTLADYMQREHNVSDALYLDGFISKMYCPTLGLNECRAIKLGPVISISIPEKERKNL